jgi:hypothetical protein
MSRGKEIELKVGRRSIDGIIRLTNYAPQLVQLSVSYKGERSSSVVLTREQIRVLRDVLGEFEEAMAAEANAFEGWDQKERRNSQPA